MADSQMKNTYFKLMNECSNLSEWDKSISYEFGSIVVYNKVIYISLCSNNKGIVPTNSNKWKVAV